MSRAGGSDDYGPQDARERSDAREHGAGGDRLATDRESCANGIPEVRAVGTGHRLLIVGAAHWGPPHKPITIPEPPMTWPERALAFAGTVVEWIGDRVGDAGHAMLLRAVRRRNRIAAERFREVFGPDPLKPNPPYRKDDS